VFATIMTSARSARPSTPARWNASFKFSRKWAATPFRTSHNPPAPELLDWCDRLGLVVMDESFRLLENRQDKE